MAPRARFGALAAACVLAGCGGGDEATPRPTPFDYDPEAPLAVRLVAEEIIEGVRVADLSYAVPRTSRVNAFLVRPVDERRYPVVFFQHGSGGSRLDFFDEGVEVARRGAAALLIDAPGAQSFRGSVIGNVVAWRRAVDLVASREDVDAERVAFVGLSYGAAVGGLLAAAEPRIESFVLVSGPPRLRGYQMADLAPERWVARSPHGELFFQAGRRDEVIAQVDLEDYFEAASEPKRISWYDAGHVPGERARDDRLRWISERLGLR